MYYGFKRITQWRILQYTRSAALAFVIPHCTLLRRSKRSGFKKHTTTKGQNPYGGAKSVRYASMYIEQLDRCKLSTKLPMGYKGCQLPFLPNLFVIAPPPQSSYRLTAIGVFSPVSCSSNKKQKILGADCKHAHNLDDMQRQFEKLLIAKEDWEGGGVVKQMKTHDGIWMK